MLKRIKETTFGDRFDRIKGAKVYGSDGEKIGTLDDLLIEPANSSNGYAIVDSGGWLRSRRFVVPLDYLDFSERDESALVAPVTKQQIENLPEWDDRFAESGDFEPYEASYRTRWNSFGLQPSRRTGATPSFIWDRRPVSSTVATGAPLQRNAVYGVYGDQAKLETAVDRLKKEGFQNSEI
jgi:hypothetical protein